MRSGSDFVFMNLSQNTAQMAEEGNEVKAGAVVTDDQIAGTYDSSIKVVITEFICKNC